MLSDLQNYRAHLGVTGGMPKPTTKGRPVSGTRICSPRNLGNLSGLNVVASITGGRSSLRNGKILLGQLMPPPPAERGLLPRLG